MENTPNGLRALLARDHRELEQLFDALSNALRADAREDTLRLWRAFDDGLCRHMMLEEEHLLPRLRKWDSREVDAIVHEHDEIRAKLAELGVGVDLHTIPAQTICDFIDQLCRHAHREDELAYGWAEANLQPSEQQAVRRGLDTARAFRKRLAELGKKARARFASIP